MTIKFGTDGWRAVISDTFTFANLQLVAQAIADYILEEASTDQPEVVVGFDTRFLSDRYATEVARVLAGNGIIAWLTRADAPTPAVSYNVVHKKAVAGVMITASHNAPRYNGVKLKAAYGGSASRQQGRMVELFLERNQEQARGPNMIDYQQGLDRGLIRRFDPAWAYYEHLGRLLDVDVISAGELRVVADSMYGSGRGCFREFLSRTRTRIREIRGEMNPGFGGIHPEPIARYLTALVAAVQADQADVGLATDGDADRMGVIDEKGSFVTQLQIFALLSLYLLEVRGERGPIVKTVTSTSMLYRLGELFKVPVYETTVGFKVVAPVMLAKDALIGGEESGGYGFRGHVAERDGILASLYFLDLMVKTGKTPSQLVEYLYSKVGPHYYNRADVKFPAEKRQAIVERLRHKPPQSIEGVRVVKVDTADGFRFTLADTTWLLIRFSGTEPILRIYAETNSPERVERLLKFGRELTGV